ncbi:hypothetical protein TorRG33x02_254220 [Trema orientale]|uniref:Uncharacterized protein n=1 Tax=Trema orientale TaxID=63057 RepID=A0A2P5DE84_TREOI|nr:hypothetical protein TorRG33x02_254220 [Trema orientale]
MDYVVLSHVLLIAYKYQESSTIALPSDSDRERANGAMVRAMVDYRELGRGVKVGVGQIGLVIAVGDDTDLNTYLKEYSASPPLPDLKRAFTSGSAPPSPRDLKRESASTSISATAHARDLLSSIRRFGRRINTS